MKRIKFQLLFVLALHLLSACAIAQIENRPKASPCILCQELKNLDLPDVDISEASQVDAPVSHCKIFGTVGKEINFELLLPEDWNARFVMGGNGGFAGTINDLFENRKRVTKGYAIALTDTGHKGSIYKADWALNNMERQVNFGHLAVHRIAVVAKAIMKQYYCSAPAYSYFYGCSKGGGQGMIEAQRYPEDFDGIVAGAPAIKWPEFSAAFIHNGTVMYPEPDNLDQALISKTHLELLQASILEQCDYIDGIKDGILNDPTECNFDIELLPKCPDKEANDSCFTSSQLDGIKKVYDGVKIADVKIYPGFPFGSERRWPQVIVDPDAKDLEEFGYPTRMFAFAVDFFKYLVFQDPNWDYKSYDFSKLKVDTRYASSYLDATSTDYAAFKNRGGKMILFHGWNDAVQSAYTAIEYYEALKKEDGQVGDYIRLFMLPGVGHCFDGIGPNEVDWVELVRNWVEKNIAPERVVLLKKEDGKISITRPVFPYPKKAVYNGKGDPSKESSFN